MKFLSVDPGEYFFTFRLADSHESFGSVSLRASSPATGELQKIPPEAFQNATSHRVDESSVAITFSPSKGYFEEIRGVLQDGREIVLIDVDVMHIDIGRAHFTAKHCVVGTQITTDGPLKFESIRLQIGGLVELSGVGPLIPSEDLLTDNGKADMFSVKWNESSSQAWSVGDDTLKISFDYEAITASPFEFSVSPAAVATVHGHPRSVAQWMSDYVHPLHRLLDFATARAQPLQWIKFLNTRETAIGTFTPNAQYFGLEVTQEYEYSKRPQRDSIPLIYGGPNGMDLGAVLARWREIGDEYSVFFELFTTAFRGDLNPRAQYLVFVPSLESLHAVKHGVSRRSPEIYKAERKRYIAEAKTYGATKATRGWLSRHLSYRDDYSLPERLRSLHAGLPEEVRQALTVDLSTLPPSVREATDGDVWQIMAKIRNDTAHGGRMWSRDELAPLIRLSFALGAACMLAELGVSPARLVVLARNLFA